MTKKKKVRIGYKMEMAEEYVRDNPGCCILPVAEYVGPHGSRKYGYDIVHRAIKAGLIKAHVKPNGRYVLTVPREYAGAWREEIDSNS